MDPIDGASSLLASLTPAEPSHVQAPPTSSTASPTAASPSASPTTRSQYSGPSFPPPPTSRSPLRRVIYNPFLSQLYSAIVGKGAYLNRTTRLPLSHPSPLALAGLSDALIAVEWGSDRSKRVMEKKGRTFARLAGDGNEIEGAVMAHSLRSIG